LGLELLFPQTKEETKMSDLSMQATAAANALSSEKTFRTVNFAVTGDEETDLIAGILAVISGNCNMTTYAYSHQIPVRVLRYLLERYETNLRNIEKAQAEQREQYQNLKQGGVGSYYEQQKQMPGALSPYTPVNVPPSIFSGVGSISSGAQANQGPPQQFSGQDLLNETLRLARLNAKP
jgi:hypothetical protein